jgi:hypothetical protein
MQILTLEVNDRVAEAYNRASGEEKKKMNKLIDTLLSEVVRKNQSLELSTLMDKISSEAAINGLTTEKLGELMEWDKETMANLFGEG